MQAMLLFKKYSTSSAYLLVCFAVFGVYSAASSWASDFESPRTLALGGAGHAGPLLNDPIYLNPSFVSFNQSYAIGLSILKYSNDPYHGRNYNLSLQDGRTEAFQAGVGYTVREDASLVHVVASRQVIPTVLSAGVGAKMLFAPNQKTARDITVSMGGAVTPWMQLALITDNLIQSDEGKAHGLYREIILGSKINVMGIVFAYIDPHLAPSVPGGNSFGHEMGLEFTLMADLFLRLGTFRNSNVFYQSGLRGNGWGAGIGWVAPRISIDYALSRVNDSRGGLQQTTSHNFGATIFF